jgi:hypothetical protein
MSSGAQPDPAFAAALRAGQVHNLSASIVWAWPFLYGLYVLFVGTAILAQTAPAGLFVILVLFLLWLGGNVAHARRIGRCRAVLTDQDLWVQNWSSPPESVPWERINTVTWRLLPSWGPAGSVMTSRTLNTAGTIAGELDLQIAGRATPLVIGPSAHVDRMRDLLPAIVTRAGLRETEDDPLPEDGSLSLPGRQELEMQIWSRATTAPAPPAPAPPQPEPAEPVTPEEPPPSEPFVPPPPEWGTPPPG